MSINSQQAVERALRQIKKDEGKLSREEATLLRSTLSVIANDALQLMCKRTAVGEGYTGLQKDFALTPVAGFIDLTVPAGLNLPFNVDRSRVRVAATNATLRTIDAYETLENGNLPTDQVYYAQDGTGLRFRSTTPSLTDYVTPVKIMASYIASFTDGTLPIPPQFEAALVSTMVELALGQMNAEAVQLVEGEKA